MSKTHREALARPHWASGDQRTRLAPLAGGRSRHGRWWCSPATAQLRAVGWPPVTASAVPPACTDQRSLVTLRRNIHTVTTAAGQLHVTACSAQACSLQHVVLTACK